ncbi:restriction endonuclease subunit S [Pseudomonas alloputida]|uniref:restriction endonuclease subunit S n=1 Tax=Pseudomonas TaxID=286 RepID=UPI003EEA4A2D
MTALLTDNLPLLAGSPNGIKKLRELILELAVRGKLVQQISDDKKSSYWVDLIELEKTRLVDAGLLKKPKKAFGAMLEELNAKIPGSWCWVTLADITLGMDSGWSPACEPNPSPSNGVWGVLKTTAVQVMHYLQEENKELPAKLEPRPDAEVKIGDILFTRAGPINRVGISCFVENTRPRLMISDKIIRFHPVEVGVYGRYIALCLNSGTTASYLENAKSGMAASQVNISQEKLKLAPIPLAPLPEQHRIVAKVDELMALCDRLEAQQTDAENAHAQLVQALLDSLTQASDATDFAANWQRLAEHFHTLFTTEPSVDALKQTLLQLAVMGKLVPQNSNDEPASKLVERIQTAKQRYLAKSRTRKQKDLTTESRLEPPFEVPACWEWQTIDEVLHVTGGVTLGRKLGGRKLLSKPYLRVANVQRGRLELDHIKEVEVPEDEIEKYLLQSGDLLITEGGDWDKVGRTATWRDELPECLHQNHVFRARAVIADWEPRWAEMYLNSASAREYFAGSSKQTTNLASINMTQLRACAFPLPPLPEQHRIVAKVDQLMALCDQLKTHLTEARQLNEQLANTLVEQAVA